MQYRASAGAWKVEDEREMTIIKLVDALEKERASS